MGHDAQASHNNLRLISRRCKGYVAHGFPLAGSRWWADVGLLAITLFRTQHRPQAQL